ncbi:glycosyl transferase [Chania multitudinisentens RB-25]|uniref:Glycosyl transferase n=1 Tax=Chania multitudinisentens RB-25 TaxID=1441930 RepID=W0L8S6_9GAMM|nr:nucleotide disphospho-sugar-binding domain-containing protein [Chania multitudinisentens]AHG18365.1 glycosyl transferase [Chania multitudinisentens RB-25]
MQRLLDIIPPGVTRIDLLAPPFSGHLHPVLAMGRALSTRYQVRIISTHGAEARIQASGLVGLTLEGDYDTLLLPVVNPKYAVKSHPVRLYRQFRAVVGLLKDFADELEQVWLKEGVPDLAIADFTLPVVGEICRRFNVPWWSSLPSPCVLEGRDGAPAYCGGLMPAESRNDRFWHLIHRKKVRLFKRAMFWLFRDVIRQTGITRLYRQDGSESAYSPTRILALSEKEFEFPRTWPDSVVFIGPALYTPPTKGETPPFIAGKRHVLVTLGTHLDWHKDAVAKAVVALARTLPEWEFHFTDGDPAGGEHRRQGNFSRVSWVDYDRWLLRYDVVIHHGGAGIMWHCLKKGVPALVYPIDYDQFDHAARLEYSGRGIWLKGGLKSLENARPLLLRLSETSQSEKKA